jgi:hypothetical protein
LNPESAGIALEQWIRELSNPFQTIKLNKALESVAVASVDLLLMKEIKAELSV